MKNLTLLFTITTLLGVASCTSNASENTNTQSKKQPPVIQSAQQKIEIQICEPDYQPINYCTDFYRNKINHEASLPANFDTNKRIVTTALPAEYQKDIYDYYFVVIDLDKKTATPLYQVLTHYGRANQTGFNPNIKPTASFDVTSNQICFSGSLVAYRDAYPDVRNACYEYRVNNQGGHLYHDIDDESFYEIDLNTLEE